MRKENHGGGCCGVSHIFGFGFAPEDGRAPTGRNGGGGNIADLDQNLELFRTWDGQRNEDRKGLVEVILTDNQMVQWAATMKAKGFRLVTRFLNSNSGNYCNVLHKTFGNTRGAARPARPFQW